MQLSQSIKEKLFAKMDTMKIGLVSFEQFKELLNKSNAKLREENDAYGSITDSFEW